MKWMISWHPAYKRLEERHKRLHISCEKLLTAIQENEYLTRMATQQLRNNGVDMDEILRMADELAEHEFLRLPASVAREEYPAEYLDDSLDMAEEAIQAQWRRFAWECPGEVELAHRGLMGEYER